MCPRPRRTEEQAEELFGSICLNVFFMTSNISCTPEVLGLIRMSPQFPNLSGSTSKREPKHPDAPPRLPSSWLLTGMELFWGHHIPLSIYYPSCPHSQHPEVRGGYSRREIRYLSQEQKGRFWGS